MIRLTTLCSALAAVVCLSNSALTLAGRPDCGCSHSPVHSALALNSGCQCAAAVQSCCGYGGLGGLVRSGSPYGLTGPYAGHYGFRNYGSPDPRSFESGFEILPNLDGEGVHHRLPFHSYRRPWAHPGIADNNINLAW